MFCLLGWFERLGLYGLRFNADFDKVGSQTAYEFIQAMTDAQHHEEPSEFLENRLAIESTHHPSDLDIQPALYLIQTL